MMTLKRLKTCTEIKHLTALIQDFRPEVSALRLQCLLRTQGGRIYTMSEGLAENQRNRSHENLVELGVKRDTSDESEDKTKLQ